MWEAFNTFIEVLGNCIFHHIKWEVAMISSRMIIVLGLLVSVCASVNAQTSFDLSVKKVGSYSSKSKIDCPNHFVKTQSTALEITVMNREKTNATLKVDWAFVAQRSDFGTKLLFGNGEKSVELMAGRSTSFKVTSETLFLHERNCSEMSMHMATDAKMYGYIVRATDKTGFVKSIATQPSLKEILSSEATFSQLKKDSAEWAATRPKTLGQQPVPQPAL